MKKMISTVILAVMAVMAFSQTESNETYQRLTGIPKPPVAGTTISFEYHPQGGPLEGMKDLVALVYMYRDYRWTLADTALADNGNGSWSGSLLIPTDCAFMAFQFQSTWDQFTQTKDNNDNQGFLYVVGNGKGGIEEPSGIISNINHHTLHALFSETINLHAEIVECALNEHPNADIANALINHLCGNIGLHSITNSPLGSRPKQDIFIGAGLFWG